MSLLLAFVCENEITVKNAVSKTAELPYHRMFVLSNKFLKEYVNTNINDSFLILNYGLNNIDKIVRFIFLYSNPKYSEILIIIDEDINIEEMIKCFESQNKFIYENCIGLSRYEASENGFEFDFSKKQNVSQLDFFENISLALSGELVDEIYFNEALKELLPECKYKIDENLDIEHSINRIIQSKNKNTQVEYHITNKLISDSIKNKIIFTKSEINEYKYVIKRKDGLSCYIL